MILTVPAVGNDANWRIGTSDWDKGKQTFWGVVGDAAGNEYSIPLQEGKAHWTSPAGTEIECEIAVPAQDGKRGRVKLVTERRSGGFGGGGYQRKEYTAKQVGETAGVAARMAAYVYSSVRQELQKNGVTDASAEDVRAITNTLIIELVKRLP